MDLKMLQKIQINQDEAFGFDVKFDSEHEKIDQISKDLVGLFGEVGEFSNTVKKLTLKMKHGKKYDLDVESAYSNLGEELADMQIYLLRLAEIIDIDIENEVLEKIELNKVRYDALKK